MIRIISLFVILCFGLAVTNAQTLNQTDDKGQKQGRWSKTYVSGTLKYTGQFRDDVPYGTFNYYYPGGEIKAKTRYSDNGITAHTKMYYENGNLLAEGKYVNRKKDSVWNYYSEPEGNLIATEEYDHGVLTGESISYFAETGKILEIFHYKNGLRNGPYKKYFPDGKLMTEGYYENDTLEGEFVTYYPGGQIQVRGTYSNGLQKGNWEYFDEKGNLLTQEEFKSLGEK